MSITPDSVVLWAWGPITLNLTIVFTWAVMLLMVAGSWLVTRGLSSDVEISRWQNLLEVVVEGIENEIRAITHQDPRVYLPFVGTLFLFIAVSNVLMILPGYRAPTGSLSTTAALALCVFVAVPVFGILRAGLVGYLKHYIRPTPFMLPFHVMGEISRTLALAIRLFGNIMSGRMIVAILLGLIPLFFPILLQALGLLTGLIQAYIFAVLAMVYIASAIRAQKPAAEKAGAERGDDEPMTDNAKGK